MLPGHLLDLEAVIRDDDDVARTESGDDFADRTVSSAVSLTHDAGVFAATLFAGAEMFFDELRFRERGVRGQIGDAEEHEMIRGSAVLVATHLDHPQGKAPGRLVHGVEILELSFDRVLPQPRRGHHCRELFGGYVHVGARVREGHFVGSHHETLHVCIELLGIGETRRLADRALRGEAKVVGALADDVAEDGLGGPGDPPVHHVDRRTMRMTTERSANGQMEKASGG